MSIVNKVRLIELAESVGAELYGDGNIFITQISSIRKAQVGHITVLKDPKFREQLRSCKASAVIISRDNLDFCKNFSALVVKDPHFTYIKVAQLFNVTPKSKPNIDSGAIISPEAILGKEICIDSYAVIESGVILSDLVIIGYGCFIGKDVKIGIGTRLYPNVTIYPGVEIGNYCLIQSGTIIGSDGFGYIKRNDIWLKIPQLGRTKIGNYVEIGACSTIDRGTLDDTYIADRVIIDNQCQIAHNVVIDQCTAIAGGVIIAGSVSIGKNCKIGGASVINGHIDICDDVIITGMSMVMKSIVKSGIYSSGIPIQSNMAWRRTTVLIMRICDINKHVKMLSRQIRSVHFVVKVVSMIYFFVFLGVLGLVLSMRLFFS